jgi:hypothetical protein
MPCGFCEDAVILRKFSDGTIYSLPMDVVKNHYNKTVTALDKEDAGNRMPVDAWLYIAFPDDIINWIGDEMTWDDVAPYFTKLVTGKGTLAEHQNEFENEHHEENYRVVRPESLEAVTKSLFELVGSEV